MTAAPGRYRPGGQGRPIPSAVAEAMAAGDPLGLVPRLGDDGLKVPNGRADTPVENRQAAVRGSSDEGQ